MRPEDLEISHNMLYFNLLYITLNSHLPYLVSLSDDIEILGFNLKYPKSDAN